MIKIEEEEERLDVVNDVILFIRPLKKNKLNELISRLCLESYNGP